MEASVFTELTFGATESEHSKIIFKTIKEYLEPQKAENSLRVLDLGCGSGLSLLRLSSLLSKAILAGVDISKANIEQARRFSLEDKTDNQIDFEACDYLVYKNDPFDIIYADSVLQNIESSTEKLYQKLARDLKPKGVLIVTMPYNCFYNRFLYGVRRILKFFHSKVLDRWILLLAKSIYPKLDPKILQERIPYMYMIPYRVDSIEFRKRLEQDFNLNTILVSPMPFLMAKPKHNLIVLKKAI